MEIVCIPIPKLKGEVMEQIKISIIVPVYKVEQYLERCIKSVLQQTIDNWELILVDDASPDHSLQVCNDFAAQDDRIVVVHKANNEGALRARKSGLEAARGVYIAYLDGDDWVEPSMYGDLIQLLERTNADAAEGSFFINQSNGEKAFRNDAVTYIYSQLEALEKLHTLETIQDKLWTRVYRRECIPEFDQENEVVVGEDYSLVVHIFEHCEKIAYIGIPYYHYFQREDSVCNAGYTEKHIQVVKNCIYYRNYLSNRYPTIRSTVTAKLLFDEMAVLVAMTKNSHYDKDVIRLVTKDVRENFKYLKGAKGYRCIMRISVYLTVIHPYLLMGIYKVYYSMKKHNINKGESHETSSR